LEVAHYLSPGGRPGESGHKHVPETGTAPEKGVSADLKDGSPIDRIQIEGAKICHRQAANELAEERVDVRDTAYPGDDDRCCGGYRQRGESRDRQCSYRQASQFL
jgi:hypothetical protein